MKRVITIPRSPFALTSFIVLWAVVTLAARYAIDPLAIQHDQALYIECGIRLLGGQLPYVDFFDLNPPLIMYLNVPVAWVAELARVNPLPVFTAFVTLVCAASAWLMLRWTRGLGDLTMVDRLALLTIPLGPCALNWAEAGFGQREQLFVLLYLPFFVLRIVRVAGVAPAGTAPVGPVAAVAAGLATGCGIAIKPHFLLPVLCVEAVLMWRARSWRSLLAPELAGMVAFPVLYAAHFLLLPAAMREAFFHRVIPVVSGGYAAYDPPVRLVVSGVVRRGAFLIAVALLAAWFGERRLKKPFLLPAVAFGAGALVMAAMQLKNFRYHYIPLDTMIVFLAVTALAGAGRRVPALTAAITIAGLLTWPIVNQRFVSKSYPFRDVVGRYSDAGDPVAFMTSGVDPTFPAVLQERRRLVTRHIWSIMLMLSLNAQARGHAWAAEEERRFADETADDLERGRPTLIVIEDRIGCLGCPSGFTLHKWSLQQPRLAAILSTYRLRGIEQHAAIYTR